MASLIANGKQQYFDNAGIPLVGGKLYTYAAGTTNPKATYTDADATIPNANPVILNARGEAQIFWSGSYKVTLTDALGNIIWTVDKVTETNLGYRTSSNGSAITPSGTTAQRDAAPMAGYFRYNVDLGNFEGYYGTTWQSFVKSMNGSPIPEDGNILVQVPLVSGTNIKTVGGTSILGSGDVPLPSAVAQNLYLYSNAGGL